MTITWSIASNPGRVRNRNEDSAFPVADGSAQEVVIAVADGMGGHIGGEVASQLAVRAAIAAADRDAADRVRVANEAIMSEALRKRHLSGMGTTLTLALFAGDTVSIGHVGDSRAYRWRDGELVQLTRDHSLVMEYLAAGRITEEEALDHPQRNILTRALGLEWRMPVDELVEHLRAGDRYLLCTDGLTTMVTDEGIADLLDENPLPQEAAWALIEAANLAGGDDNVTVAVIDISA